MGALAPGTTSPSMAVVRNTWLPQTMGEECPRPGSGVFQAMFFVGAQSEGSSSSDEMPWLSGPRHCGQLAACRLVASTTAVNEVRLARRS